MITLSLRRLAGLTRLASNCRWSHICSAGTSGALVSWIGSPSTNRSSASTDTGPGWAAGSTGVEVSSMVTSLHQSEQNRERGQQEADDDDDGDRDGQNVEVAACLGRHVGPQG